MKPCIVVENVRSAFNVGNIIRTADALWFDVVLSGYSPSPFRDEKVKKSSLGAEDVVTIHEFWNPDSAVGRLEENWYSVFAAEISSKSISLEHTNFTEYDHIAIVVWNEKTGVLRSTLERVEKTVHIPMNWIKDSLNVWQAAAIMMWEVSKVSK